MTPRVCEIEMMIYQMSDSFDGVGIGSFFVEQEMFFVVKKNIAMFGDSLSICVLRDFTKVLKSRESKQDCKSFSILEIDTCILEKNEPLPKA